MPVLQPEGLEILGGLGRGFTEGQLQSLNFAAMDLSEFIQKIVPKEADLAGSINRAGQSVSDQVKNYYEQD